MLGSQESLDADMYLKCPSFEVDLCTGVTFKKSHRARIQLEPGHPDAGLFYDKPGFLHLSQDQEGTKYPWIRKP